MFEFKIGLSTYLPLDLFGPGVKYHRGGYCDGLGVFARSTGREWAATVCGESMRDATGVVHSFETPEAALRYAIEAIEAETREVALNVAAYGWDEPEWRRGVCGPNLGTCPTLQTTKWPVWTVTGRARVIAGPSRIRPVEHLEAVTS